MKGKKRTDRAKGSGKCIALNLLYLSLPLGLSCKDEGGKRGAKGEDEKSFSTGNNVHPRRDRKKRGGSRPWFQKVNRSNFCISGGATHKKTKRGGKRRKSRR